MERCENITYDAVWYYCYFTQQTVYVWYGIVPTQSFHEYVGIFPYTL